MFRLEGIAEIATAFVSGILGRAVDLLTSLWYRDSGVYH